MTNEKPQQTNEELSRVVKQIAEKSGKVLLTSDEILVLACGEIIRTYTRDEKGYA